MTKFINLAGWGTREFTLDELANYLKNSKFKVLEISKYFVEGPVSIKQTFNLIKNYKQENNSIISYAGTSDFVNCSGMSFKDYLDYLSIQVAQARFLQADTFRVLVGGKLNSSEPIMERLLEFAEMIKPMRVLIEIHGGWESSMENIKEIVKSTDFNFVIDFQNILESDLSYELLHDVISEDRIEYFHTRNINSFYVEHEISLKEEKKWVSKNLSTEILWEPKLIEKKKLVELIK